MRSNLEVDWSNMLDGAMAASFLKRMELCAATVCPSVENDNVTISATGSRAERAHDVSLAEAAPSDAVDIGWQGDGIRALWNVQSHCHKT